MHSVLFSCGGPSHKNCGAILPSLYNPLSSHPLRGLPVTIPPVLMQLLAPRSIH